ncbi:unnamed protein product [Penicillium salamii]|uniref:SET domain-containing protein n=1 Tax=Penicillium salamii TaxID=1612424 RepID=A0A9W4JT57_9EURO|nr:unnamed protein product [Penicillium salamii]CAG8029462.1 unnamed protein product [Penicillium salamii]CAG8064412.1 unnamed protein product [Penicillium salamii]CAG8309327.1 unnamed protein product [Penicillium salamii]CAG8315864.1 unnamed protein product [Penicillium salamii]
MSTFRATTRHKKENEVFMNYGSHPNNYLFIEYKSVHSISPLLLNTEPDADK